jgi:hypothetical protein
VHDGCHDVWKPQPGRQVTAVISSSGRASSNCGSVAYRPSMRRCSCVSGVLVDTESPLSE